MLYVRSFQFCLYSHFPISFRVRFFLIALSKWQQQTRAEQVRLVDGGGWYCKVEWKSCRLRIGEKGMVRFEREGEIGSCNGGAGWMERCIWYFDTFWGPIINQTFVSPLRSFNARTSREKSLPAEMCPSCCAAICSSKNYRTFPERNTIAGYAKLPHNMCSCLY